MRLTYQRANFWFCRFASTDSSLQIAKLPFIINGRRNCFNSRAAPRQYTE